MDNKNVKTTSIPTLKLPLVPLGPLISLSESISDIKGQNLLPSNTISRSSGGGSFKTPLKGSLKGINTDIDINILTPSTQGSSQSSISTSIYTSTTKRSYGKMIRSHPPAEVRLSKERRDELPTPSLVAKIKHTRTSV